jgi:hypothetical protein
MTALFTAIPATQQDRDWLAEQMKESARAAVEREAELNSPVITMQDAMRLAQIASPTAWQRWLRKWRVKSVGHGRYARFEVMNALKIEAGERGNMARERILSASSK